MPPDKPASRRNMVTARGLTISPPLLLAPMAGITHSAFRAVLAELGGVGLFYTEMLAARGLPCENPRISPFLIRTPAETPLAYQLLVGAAKDVEPAIDALHTLGADAVDINMGCPAPNARKMGGGARLMDDRDTARGLVRQARMRTGLPLGAKIRLGKRDGCAALLDFCSMLEGEGVDFLSVHARFADEPFARPARWDLIRGIVSRVSIPVFTNGGVFSVDDAKNALAASGADGLMIGRGAAVRPWLIRDIAREVFRMDLPREEPTGRWILLRFAKNLADFFPAERRLGRLKEFTHYIAKAHAFGHTLASGVQSARSFDEAVSRAESFFDKMETNSA